MRFLEVLILLLGFDSINVKATVPAYLVCFKDCFAGQCGYNANQYSSGRDIQFIAGWAILK